MMHQKANLSFGPLAKIVYLWHFNEWFDCLSWADLDFSTSLGAFEDGQGSHLRYSVCPNRESHISINQSTTSACRVFQLVQKNYNSSRLDTLSWEQVLSKF